MLDKFALILEVPQQFLLNPSFIASFSFASQNANTFIGQI
jgi:hypothetical protein